MKNLFLSAVSILVGFAAFSQDIVVNVIPIDSVGCEKQILIEVMNVSTSDDSGTLTIDWGDGSALTQQTYSVTQTTTNNSFAFYTLNHSYAVGGNYTIDVQGASALPGVIISIPQGNQLISAIGSNSCGYAYFGMIINNSTCSPNIMSNAQLDFTDNLNNTTTVTGFWNMYNGLNPNNAPYTVSVNDAWLAANNLSQTSADIVITSFGTSGMSLSATQTFSVEWVVTSTNTDADPSFGWGSAWDFVAPLQTGTLRVNFLNLTCLPMTSNMMVNITMPLLFVPNTSGLLNANVSGNIVSFEVPSFIGSSEIVIPFTFPGTTAAGTGICFNVELSYTSDINVFNNTGQICGQVLNSYDPNDKQVNLAERLNPDSKEKLIYKIQFQNDGNYNAVNVNITDVIDTDLDLSTLRVLESSHSQSAKVNATTRQVDFTFNNIMLGASSENLALSQGYIVYEIEENANLALGTEIENTANIYFDFNPAIVTNTTYNINEYELGIKDLDKSALQFYPNPVKENITFKGEIVQEVKIFDLSGKVVLSNDKIVNNTLSLGNLNNGLYTILVKTNTGSSTAKMSIQR
jgi:uncharacterized repeat protein (TIGR01451 family)